MVIFRLNLYLGVVIFLIFLVYGFFFRVFIYGFKLVFLEERKRYLESVIVFKEGIDGRFDIKIFDVFDYFIKRVLERFDCWVNVLKRVVFYSIVSYGFQLYLLMILLFFVFLSGIVFVKNGMVIFLLVIVMFIYFGRVYYLVE